MTTVTLIPPQSPPGPPPVVYLSSDGEPLAETSTHLDSDVLTLRLVVEVELIGFYRDDTGEKLLVPDELYVALKQEVAARQAAEERAEQEQQRTEQERQRAEQEQQRSANLEALLAQYRDRFGELPESGQG